MMSQCKDNDDSSSVWERILEAFHSLPEGFSTELGHLHGGGGGGGGGEGEGGG